MMALVCDYASDLMEVVLGFIDIAWAEKKHRQIDDFTQRTLLHKGWTNLSHKDTVSLAVNVLVERDWLSEHQSEKAGRKTTIYKINPRISEEHL